MVYLKKFGCPDDSDPRRLLVRPIHNGTRPQYYQLRIDGGFTSPWDDEAFKKYRPKLTPNGLILVKHIRSGRLVAAASAESAHPATGSAFWRLPRMGHCAPDFRGKNSKARLHNRNQKTHRRGYAKLVLSTDDFRIPAIATYTQYRMAPWLYEPDMQERWQNVLKTLQQDKRQAVELPPNNPWENYPTTIF